MNETEFAHYSNVRLVVWAVGPFVALAIGYALLSPYPLSYVFSLENLTRSTPFRPSPIVSIGAMLAWLGIVLYQVITIGFLNKKFVWTNGRDLMIGYRNKGPLSALRPQESTVSEGPIGERVTLLKADGSRILISMALTPTSGAELLERIAAKLERRS